MEAKLMRRIQRSGWDLASTSYEDLWGRQLQPAIDALITRADLVAGEQVLDVACGTGLATLAAARLVGPNGRVLATDLAPKMVESLAERARRAGLGNVDAEARDAESLTYDSAFDVALCSLGLMYVPDPVRALRGMHDAVRRGGRIVASVWGERRNCGWAEIFPIVDARVSSDVCPMFFALGARGALQSAFEQAGLADVTEVRLRVDLAYATPADAVGAAFDGGPVALANSRFDDEVRRSAHSEYLASIAPYADAGGYRVPGEFVIVSGRRP